ncbi:MAG: hypothetical protein ACXVBU_04790 [Ktedonobacteraceae bacterium]
MVGQAPSQNATQASSNVATAPRVLLEDSIFKSIHDAFQMGWNIIELKSRLQLASVSSNISGIPTTVPMNTAINSTQTHELIQKVLPNVAHAQANLLLPEANFIQPQPATVTAPRINLTKLPDNAWSASLWRATFNCIADSHKNCFPDSSTEDTYYDLPNPPDSSNPPNYQSLVTNVQTSNPVDIHLPYYYLYPDNNMDYANVGIPQDNQFPDTFKLYDVTRRALNCLTLLYTNPEDSLTPLTVSYFQQQLLQNISTYKELAATLISNTSPLAQSQTNAGVINQGNAPQATGTEAASPEAGTNTTNVGGSTILSPEQQRADAIQLVSNHTMRYLENWDSFAHETLYVSGSGIAQSNELQLVAYEAGRAMSSLSWGITTTTMPLEDAASPMEESEILLQKAWLNVFDEPTISSIQHQISALSTAMDGAYYRVHTDISRPSGNTTKVAQNLDLPSQGIQAISASLDYWKRALKKICDEDNQQQTQTPAVTGTASQAAQSTSQSTAQNRDTISSTSTPTTGGNTQSSSIPKMNAQTSSQLRQALIKQTQVWQPLVLHQQSLQDFTMSFVTQRIWNDFMQEFEQATSKGVFNTVEKNFRRYLIPIIAGITVLILILGFLVFLLVRFPDLQQSLVTTFVLVIGSVVGFFGTTAGRMRSFFSSESASANAAVENAGPIVAIAGIAGTGLIDAFQSGYQQIQTEFDYLDHNVSVTYPLVEFFISNATTKPDANSNGQSQSSDTRSKAMIKNAATTDTDDVIKDAYDFLTQIVWTDQDKAEEIARIARAALGPIGALIAVPNQS